jgi:hypothetical protein
MVSSLTGKLGIYHETFHIVITEHSATPPDVDGIVSKVNGDLITEGVDGLCDQVLVMQGIFQDQYKPRIWINEEQPTLAIRLGFSESKKLIAPIIIAAIIIAVLIFATAVVILVAVYILSSSFTTIAQWILQPPAYVGGTPDNPRTFTNAAEYMTYQLTLFWYVCPKCGAGFGLKSKYPNIVDVPEAEKTAFEEHKKDCLGIQMGAQNVLEFVLWTGLIVAGGFVVVWLITSLGKEATQIVPMFVPTAAAPGKAEYLYPPPPF